MNIYAIKTNEGFFITDKPQSGWGNDTGLSKYYFDGELPEPTFSERWSKIPKKPKKITQCVIQPRINHRFELIDKSMETETIKPVFKREDVAYYEDYDWLWKEEYAHLSSLYRLESDEQPVLYEPIDFEFIEIMEVDKIVHSPDFKYKVNKTQWKSDGTIDLKEENIRHQLLDEVIFPDIVLPQRPSSLSSHKSYKIVRQYIKDNINPQYAEITSDYDFCFTVEKKIKLSEAEKYSVDVNFMTKKRPKYEQRYKRERHVEVFEMTHSPKGYNDYTPIKGFTGDSHEDLKKNIDNYLKDLINFINTPLVDCKCCKGYGVELDEVRHGSNKKGEK